MEWYGEWIGEKTPDTDAQGVYNLFVSEESTWSLIQFCWWKLLTFNWTSFHYLLIYSSAFNHSIKNE